MDAAQIRSLTPELRKYLKGFADCFSRSDTGGHLSTNVAGQLSDLPRKNCEPIAGVTVHLGYAADDFHCLNDTQTLFSGYRNAVINRSSLRLDYHDEPSGNEQ